MVVTDIDAEVDIVVVILLLTDEEALVDTESVHDVLSVVETVVVAVVD